MPTVKSDPVADLLDRGRRLLEQGEYEQAAAVADRARQLAPKRPGPVLLAAQAAALREGPERKVDILRDALETVGNDLPVRRQLAEALLQTGQYDAARAEIQTVVDRGEASFADYLRLGRGAFAEDDFEAAERFANLARTRAPEKLSPVLLLARIAQRQGDPQRSIDLLGSCEGPSSEDIRILRQLAGAFVQIGDLESARSHVETIFARGEAAARDYLALARTSLDERDHAQAASLTMKALDLAEGDPAPVLQLAKIAEVQGGPAAKAEVLRTHIGKVGDEFTLRLNLAGVYRDQGKRDDAIAVLRDLDLEKCSQQQIFILSGMYEMCGRVDLARDCYSRIDATGRHGGALLLKNVLSGAMDPAEALDSHERNGLPKDNYYHALLAYRRKLGARGTDWESEGLRPEAREKFGQYFEAWPYFDAVSDDSAADALLVSIVAPIHRVEDEANLVKQLTRQDYPALEAVVVINGPGFDAGKLRAELERSARFRRVHVETLPAAASLTASLNAGLSLSQGAFIARFDADDIYMDRYVSRTIALMRHTSADLCGKSHIFVHFETLGCNAALSVNDTAYSLSADGHLVQGSGSTLVMTRAVASRIRFDETLSAGEDRDLYLRSNTAGFRMVYAPPFDHIVMRREDKTLHTWQLGDARLLANSRHGYFLSGGSVADLERQTEQFLVDADRLCVK